MSHRPDYPSDLTDEEWQIIEPLVPAVESGGRPAEHGRREIVNAVVEDGLYLFSQLATGRNLATYSRQFAPQGAKSRGPSSATKRGYLG